MTECTTYWNSNEFIGIRNLIQAKTIVNVNAVCTKKTCVVLTSIGIPASELFGVNCSVHDSSKGLMS